MSRKLSFDQACTQFTQRFTMEHIPAWARKQREDGTYYAPNYRNDREWYDNTVFHGESDLASKSHCYSTNPTWPLGKVLCEAFKASQNL
jgi:hypothetical protein